jgi:hypothetical protein
MNDMNKMTDDMHKRFFISRARDILANDLNTDADKLRSLDEIVHRTRCAEEVHDTELADAFLLDAFNLSNELLKAYASTGKCSFSVYMPGAERVVDEAYDAFHAIDNDPSSKAVMEYIADHHLTDESYTEHDGHVVFLPKECEPFLIQAMFYGYVVCRTHLMKEQALAMEQAQATVENMLGGLGGKVLGLGMNLSLRGMLKGLGLGAQKEDDPEDDPEDNDSGYKADLP